MISSNSKLEPGDYIFERELNGGIWATTNCPNPQFKTGEVISIIGQVPCKCFASKDCYGKCRVVRTGMNIEEEQCLTIAASGNMPIRPLKGKMGKLFCQYTIYVHDITHPSHPGRVLQPGEADRLCNCRLKLDFPHWHNVSEDGNIDWDYYEALEESAYDKKLQNDKKIGWAKHSSKGERTNDK